MQKWEYHYMEIWYPEEDEEDDDGYGGPESGSLPMNTDPHYFYKEGIDELGLKGWELACSITIKGTTDLLVFKRPLKR